MMRTRSCILLIASLCLAGSAAQALTKCPSSTTSTKSSDGYTYESCPNTDYQGVTAKGFDNIGSLSDCLDLCFKNQPCDKVVYDKQVKYCHLKGSDTYGLVWAQNQRFDSARRVDVGNVGKWGAVIKLPVIPVAAYVVPSVPDSSRLLCFSSWSPNDFGGEGGMTQFADYNWKTGQVSQRTVVNTHHDMFCPGISQLADGKIIISGGADAANTSIYDPITNQFTIGPLMNKPRGYQSSSTLSNGKIFTIGGSYTGGFGGKLGELYDPTTNKWSLLPNASPGPMLTTDHEGAWRTDNHAWLWAWRDGSVFQAGPSKTMNWYRTSGSGSVQVAGIRDADNDAMCGVNVMYDAGKIFTAGGSQDYTNSDAFNSAHLITIGAPGQQAAVEQVANMRYQRGFANAVVLPDGTILVTGGQKRSLVFTNTDSSLPAELFDPRTKTFRTLAEEAIPRNYHSVSVLLADGTVFSGGGGLCYVGRPGNNDAGCDRSVDHEDGQIFSPPYLFNADGSSAARPIMRAVRSSTSSTGSYTRAGGTVTVTMADTATGVAFSLIRLGSSTHSINTDQRRVALTNVRQNAATWTLALPSDNGVLIPGFYYLFAVNSKGVPSVAKTIQVRL